VHAAGERTVLVHAAVAVVQERRAGQAELAPLHLGDAIGIARDVCLRRLLAGAKKQHALESAGIGDSPLESLLGVAAPAKGPAHTQALDGERRRRVRTARGAARPAADLQGGLLDEPLEVGIEVVVRR